MADIIVIAMIVIAVGAAGLYIYKAKKRGQGCVGCPNSHSCGSCKCRPDDSQSK